MDKRKGILAIIICLAMTALMFFDTIIIPIRQRTICTEKAMATIVKVIVYDRYDEETDPELNDGDKQHNRTYSYVYQFSVNGKSYKGRGCWQIQLNSLKRSIGDKQIIRYKKSNPQVFMKELGVTDYLLMLMTLSFVAVTILLIQKVTGIGTIKAKNKDIFQ